MQCLWVNYIIFWVSRIYGQKWTEVGPVVDLSFPHKNREMFSSLLFIVPLSSQRYWNKGKFPFVEQ